MSQVHHVTPSLLDFPVEILLDILGHLDVYDLVRAHQICKDVRQVIDSSSELLYMIDLKHFNAILIPSTPGLDCSIPTLRKLLLQSESAWQKAKYITRDPIVIPYLQHMYRWSCGGLQQIAFFQPQLADNHSDATILHQWGCKINSAVSHHNFSPAQDLVILLTRASLGESYAYDVIFRSLSEDKAHPVATSAVVKALDNEIDLEVFNPYNPKSSIFGNYYGVLFRNISKPDGGAADFLQIWNWKSKDTFQCLKVFDPACKTMNFSFLTNEKLIVVNTRELLLYSLVCSANTLQLTVKFSLPALRSHFEYECISFNPIPFHARAHKQIIAINMDIFGGSLTTDPCFTLFVQRNTLLELESTYTNSYRKTSEDSSSLPWPSWGPNNTRFFEESSYDPCKHSILVGNGTKCNQQLIEGETPSSDLFLDSFGSGLPYLETTTEKFLSTDMTMEGHRVALLSYEVMRSITMSEAGEQSFEQELVQGFEVLDFQ
ncbi:hypothetical protein EDB19DRAFT_1765712 [Suillus lakei]|nr:hypothetical protein EDB19DRAFT_1765712 [Suillus lakei]